MESILTSIKKLLGITEEYTHFDQDIIMHINSVFMVLNQLGVGPSTGFSIEDSTTTWADFIPDMTAANVEGVKTYMYLKVRMLFDPPTNSSVIESYNRTIAEYESRLNIAVDPGNTYTQSIDIDYTKLKNLPKINGETLVDNYDEQDPTVGEVTVSKFDELWSKHFSK